MIRFSVIHDVISWTPHEYFWCSGSPPASLHWSMRQLRVSLRSVHCVDISHCCMETAALLLETQPVELGHCTRTVSAIFSLNPCFPDFLVAEPSEATTNQNKEQQCKESNGSTESWHLQSFACLSAATSQWWTNQLQLATESKIAQVLCSLLRSKTLFGTKPNRPAPQKTHKNSLRLKIQCPGSLASGPTHWHQCLRDGHGMQEKESINSVN